MEVQLVMFRDGGEHRPFTLSKSTTVIGRREDCDLRIAVGDVSRKHCRLILDAEDGMMRIEDLGSSNGTFVNGKRVQTSPLRAGDTLQVGPVVFVVLVDGAPLLSEVTPTPRVNTSSSLDEDSPSAATPARATSRDKGAAGVASTKKVQSIDDEIGDIDELEILNDSGGDSRGDVIDLDEAEK